MIASNKITVKGEKVGCAYREEPDVSFSNDTGWRFLAGSEDDDYLSNSNNFNVFDVNTICNYDNDVLLILESRIGSVFVRDGDSLIENKNQ